MKLYFRIRLMQLIIPVITGFIGFILALLGTALVSLWVGVPQATDRMASHWTEKAFAAGVPSIWSEHAYYVIRFIAFLTIGGCWIVLSFITVFIVKLVF